MTPAKPQLNIIYIVIAVVFFLSFLGSGFSAEAGPNTAQNQNGDAALGEIHFGYPQDWSFRHVIMTGNDDAAALKAGRYEPRYIYNLVRRRAAIEEGRRRPGRPRKAGTKVDWSVSLENGYVPANMYPAKYRFDATTENCNGDYVFYALTVVSGTQANVVGISNLYTGGSSPCNGGVPSVAFAYNTITQTGGQIRTSPTISEDGTKAAFIESATAGSYFHVLVLPNPIPVPPSHTGTVISPATPASCSTPTTAGCMTTVQISAGTNTISSPYIDYNTDTAYVGTDDGNLYKISPVFGGGTPKIASDTNWPVTVAITQAGATSKVLTDPIVDDSAGLIFMGDENGHLYSISLNSPAKVVTAHVPVGWIGHGAGTGIVDPPVVVTDVANPATDQVFAFTGCSSVDGIGGAVSQLPATFATVADMTGNAVTQLPYPTVDLGSSDTNGSCTGNNVHEGDFDNQFWLTGTAGGHILACGFLNGGRTPSSPEMYMYPFTNGQINTTPNNTKAAPTTSWTINNTKGDECSPLTEFYDGTTDRLFYGVGGTDGYVKSSSITAGFPASSACTSGNSTSTCVTAPSKLGGISAIVVDNQLSTTGGDNIYFSTLAPGSVNGQSCHVAGGTANPYCAVKLTQTALQ